LLHANPGAVIGPTEVAWCRDHGQALTIVDVGQGTHFLPEDRPAEIAAALCGWLDDPNRWSRPSRKQPSQAERRRTTSRQPE